MLSSNEGAWVKQMERLADNLVIAISSGIEHIIYTLFEPAYNLWQQAVMRQFIHSTNPFTAEEGLEGS